MCYFVDRLQGVTARAGAMNACGEKTMRILYIGYMDATGPGVRHMLRFAHEVERLGHDVSAILCGSLNGLDGLVPRPKFPVREARFRGPKPDDATLISIKSFRPDLIHVWTPRHRPARTALAASYETGARIIVHCEDHEESLMNAYGGLRFDDFDFMMDRLFDSSENWTWVHPVIAGVLEAYSVGFTAICAPLVDKLNQAWGGGARLLTPGADFDLFSADSAKKREIEQAGSPILVYGGSITQFYDFDLILETLTDLIRDYPRLKLVQYGRDLDPDWTRREVEKRGLAEHIIQLGMIDHCDVPSVLATGDILIQPGRLNDLNRYRLPAKLPEYLVMSKPVVTYPVALTPPLRDGVEVMLLKEASGREMSEKIRLILSDDSLARNLGHSAGKYAKKHFSWAKQSADLVDYYEKCLTGPPLRDPGRRPSNAFYGSPECVTADELPGRITGELERLRQFERRVKATLIYRLYDWWRRTFGN